MFLFTQVEGMQGYIICKLNEKKPLFTFILLVVPCFLHFQLYNIQALKGQVHKIFDPVLGGKKLNLDPIYVLYIYLCEQP